QVPLCRRSLGARLHHHVFRSERLAQSEGAAPHLPEPFGNSCSDIGLRAFRNHIIHGQPPAYLSRPAATASTLSDSVPRTGEFHARLTKLACFFHAKPAGLVV